MRRLNQLLVLAAFSVLVAWAQTDPPGRVGRLSYLSGAVSFRTADMDDWAAAQINRPLTTGDHVWTDEGARAELHIGAAALRLNSSTAFEFLNLDDANVQIRLAEGSLSIRLRALADNETFEVDTPNVAFSLLRTGEYRIDVNPDNYTTIVTVRSGEGEVTGNNQAFPVRPGQQAVVSGTDSPTYDTAGAPSLDEWDNWCQARDRREDQSQSARYVSREMVGYQDLDDNGSWRTVPDYGSVWVPRAVVPNWAPYHYGHWVWVEPWGWTWVDDAPWGFAPFHYGRWVYVGYWAWVPGPVAVRPVYAPALVAWVGGPNFGLSVAFGGGAVGVGWFPLGPREVYVPAYRASPTYITRVNVTNTTIVNNVNITNINTNNIRYVNREAPGAVTAVPQSAFAGGRAVQSSAVAVRPDAVRSAQIMNTAPFAPTRQSVLGGAAGGGRVAQPPAAVQNRAVFARTAPPPAPVPFAQRQQALSANPGRPLDSSEIQGLRGNQPAPARSYVRPVQGSFNGRPGGGGFSPRPAGQALPAAPQTATPQPRDYQRNRDTSTPAPVQPQAPTLPPAEPNRPPRDYRPNRDTQPPLPQNPPPSAPPARIQPPTLSQPPVEPSRPPRDYRPNRDAQPPLPQNPPPSAPPARIQPPTPSQPPVEPSRPPRDYRPNRDAQPPPPQNPPPSAPPARIQPPTPSQPPVEPNRPTRDYRPNRDAQPPPSNTPPPRFEPPPPQAPREVQPQNRPAPPPRGDNRKEEKKGDRKDERDKKQ
jgi:hypothetical protein